MHDVLVAVWAPSSLILRHTDLPATALILPFAVYTVPAIALVTGGVGLVMIPYVVVVPLRSARAPNPPLSPVTSESDALWPFQPVSDPLPEPSKLPFGSKFVEAPRADEPSIM